MGQCLRRATPPPRAAISFIPLYMGDASMGREEWETRNLVMNENNDVNESDTSLPPENARERALAQLHRTQSRLARRQITLVELEQHARQCAVQDWARRPDTPATDPALHAHCRRQAQLHLHEAREYAASAQSVTALELHLTTLKVQLSTMAVTADALGILNDYSSQLAREVKQLRERVDLRELLRTVEHNAVAMRDVTQTLDDASVLTEGIDEAALESELDALEREYACTSLRQTVVAQPSVAQPPSSPTSSSSGLASDRARRLMGMLQ